MRLTEVLGLESGNMVFYHGGNLDGNQTEFIPQKGGRYEYGPGLYLTDHQGTAEKYAKGSRKLYRVEVEPGVDLQDATLSVESVRDFVQKFVSKPKREWCLALVERRVKDGRVPAYMFSNILLNEKLMKPSNIHELRKFLVENNIDYETVKNPFGWGENMLVLYNMKKIKSVQKVSR